MLISVEMAFHAVVRKVWIAVTTVVTTDLIAFQMVVNVVWIAVHTVVATVLIVLIIPQ